jgi:hypothetical protein
MELAICVIMSGIPSHQHQTPNYAGYPRSDDSNLSLEKFRIAIGALKAIQQYAYLYLLIVVATLAFIFTGVFSSFSTSVVYFFLIAGLFVITSLIIALVKFAKATEQSVILSVILGIGLSLCPYVGVLLVSAYVTNKIRIVLRPYGMSEQLLMINKEHVQAIESRLIGATPTQFTPSADYLQPASVAQANPNVPTNPVQMQSPIPTYGIQKKSIKDL